MSLFGSVQLANNALLAQQIGLQVVGQNIANANTPGYSREQVIFSPAPTQRQGDLLLGLGVQVQGVVQIIDEFLEARLRGAISDRFGSEEQEKTYLELESLVGELTDTDLSTSLDNFFSNVSEVLNQPESISVRNLAVLRGRTLAEDIQRLATRTDAVRLNLNERVVSLADDINRLLEEVRLLNIRITTTEGGDISRSDAVGLRDQRNQALSKLSELIDIQVKEQTSGAVNVFTRGEFLVFEGTAREVAAVSESDSGISLASIRIKVTDSLVGATSGQLAGLVASRDQIVGKFLDDLDDFTQTFIFEFNKVFSSGQGLSGYTTLTSEFAVDDADLSLEAAGLEFTPVNGSFQVLVRNTQTGVSETSDIVVDLNGLDDNDTTLNNLVAQLNGISGISASITPTRELQLAVNSPNLEFSFANDSSGVLAALGLNTLFSGSTARNIGVNQEILNDPGKFTASRDGIGTGTDNAVLLSGFLDKPLDTQNGASITVVYDRLVASVTQGSAVAQAVTTGFRAFEETLRGQTLATSGVSLDEESIRLISFQRAFQASARFISELNELLEVLVNL